MSINTLNQIQSLPFIEDSHLEKFEQYKNLLQKWGKVHNLTGVQDDKAIYENILDSIFPTKFLELENISKIADIGSGAGFPAIPLAIILPDIEFLLIEPRVKRVSFMNTVRLNLGLKNVKIIEARVEDIEDYQADLILSRAVANTDLLLDISANISTTSTQYLLYKGQEVRSEITNLKNYDIIEFGSRNYLYIKEI
jgi:16S rRNA (guanine527-N7)-methyltransferase